MFNAIRARISRAFAALFAMTVVAFAFLVPTAPANAASYGGGFRSSYSSVRVYSAPRMYVAPRAVYVAPRPMVIVRPRPVIIARPMLMPYVAPTMIVNADGSGQQPVAVVQRSSGVSVLYAFLLVLVIIALVSGIGYGVYYVNPMGWWAVESSFFAVDSMLMDSMAVDTLVVDTDYGMFD